MLGVARASEDRAATLAKMSRGRRADVSFDIVLQSPLCNATDQDRVFAAEGAFAVLGPFLDESERTIVTPDGEAAFYGSDDLGSGVMVNHASGEAIWGLLVAVARAAEF
jgi:hypothetical protein